MTETQPTMYERAVRYGALTFLTIPTTLYKLSTKEKWSKTELATAGAGMLIGKVQFGIYMAAGAYLMAGTDVSESQCKAPIPPTVENIPAGFTTSQPDVTAVYQQTQHGLETKLLDTNI